MSKVTRSLTSLPTHMALYALIMFLAFAVGCSELKLEDTENSPWVSASPQIEQSLGVSTWYVDTLDEGSIRIVGYDQSDIQLSEMIVSAPVLNQVQTLIYELHVTHHTRVVMTESGILENTLSVEPRGNEWFDAMVDVQSLAKKSSNVNKSFVDCVTREAGLEIGNIVCDLAGGNTGSPTDYITACIALYNCFHERVSNYDDTELASNNTGSTAWSSNDNASNDCYDSWGYVTPCQNNYQSDYQSDYQNNESNLCYDSWGYQISCDTW